MRVVLVSLLALSPLFALDSSAFSASSPSSALERGAPQVPLSDLGTGTYLGYSGGLYPDGKNEPPADHLALGLAATAGIVPRDAAGLPSPTGKVVLLSIGMSNTTQEFCGASGSPPCETWSFVGQAKADPAVNRSTLVFVNGARGGQTSDTWTSVTSANYVRIRDVDLPRAGVTEAQVQAAWVKVANAGPTRSLPAADSDAMRLVGQIGTIARTLRTRYPNLRAVYLSSRIYAGYATTALNPEPYAFESGLAVKWVIEAQIRQVKSGGASVDPLAGNLDPATVAPWLWWGPYLWANGLTARSDGLTWSREDLQADGTHPSRSGQEKVGGLLLAFFRASPTTRAWFLELLPPPRERLVVPTVASATGLLGSSWRTSLALHNPGGTTATGRLVFHREGRPGSAADPVLPYALAPGQTRSFPDLFAAMGTSGVGSLDLLVDGGVRPVAVCRVFDDRGEAGTFGTTVDLLAASDALATRDVATLLVPADLSVFRLNVGVRSLEAGASLAVTLRTAAGELVRTLTRDYVPDLYLQTTAADFLDGAPLSGGESITIEVTRGSAHIFGATADNRTQDPSVQIPRAPRM